ncbi:DUF2004 domain-containing protein [Neisseria bergeri]|uniref:DUF2004 domain-containing protein n=1 Tax=Neisseria bergeri TaxID=1906581 RepID=UPI000E594BB2|nr:DUF2004 domain-containing protein [Neisseria bergeri]
MSIFHPYFRQLSTEGFDGEEDVLWEDELTVKGNLVEVSLWAENENSLPTETLDAFAAFLSELEKADDAARAALTEYLKRDSRYIDFHTEDTQTSRDAAKFVRTMQLTYISLWAESPAFAVMDYMPANMESDGILAVKLHLDGSIFSIDWES